MTIKEFEERVNTVRAQNGWRVEIECIGVWIVAVYDKETNERLGETGAFGLEGILMALETPLDHTVWTGK